MVIIPFQAHKIIEAYNQQLVLKTRVSAGKKQDLVPKDVVTISAESRLRLVAAGSSQESVKSLTIKKEDSLKKGGLE